MKKSARFFFTQVVVAQVTETPEPPNLCERKRFSFVRMEKERGERFPRLARTKCRPQTKDGAYCLASGAAHAITAPAINRGAPKFPFHVSCSSVPFVGAWTERIHTEVATHGFRSRSLRALSVLR